MNDETVTQRKNEQVISAPILDCDAYRTDLADFDLTAQQENELLSILWDIMRTMCDLNLDMDVSLRPAQNAPLISLATYRKIQQLMQEKPKYRRVRI